MNPLELNEHTVLPMSLPLTTPSSSSSTSDELENSNTTQAKGSLPTTIQQTTTRTSYKRANSVSFEDRDKIRTRLNSSFNNLFKGAYQDNNTSTTNNDDIFRRNRANSIMKPTSAIPSTPNFNKSVSNLTDFGSPFDPLSSYFSDHRSLKSSKSCKLISTDELCQLLIRHYTTELPEVENMFPWLHGVHKNNYAQIRFLSSLSFGLNDEELKNEEYTSKINTPLNTRGLMIIRSSNTNGEMSTFYENVITETTGLIKGTVSSHDILMSVIGVRNIGLYLHSILTEDILKYYPIDLIIKDCFNTKLLPIFKDMDPQVGVSLRNFHIQVSKMSNISDLVVYCFNDDHKYCIESSVDDDTTNKKCKCTPLARLLHIAQLQYLKSHPSVANQAKSSLYKPNKYYNTFVLDDAIMSRLDSYKLLSIPLLNPESSIKCPGDLCSEYDLEVFNNWDSNYLYREKLEISKMSSATPVIRNVWFGNTTDFECLHIQSNLNSNSNIKDENGSEIKEKYERSEIPLHCDPRNTIVALTKKDLSKKPIRELDSKLITFPKSNWKFFVHCVDGARFPSFVELKNIFMSLSSLDQIYLEFPPSGAVGLGDLSEEDILSIVNVCKLLYYRCTSDFTGLLYCSDGYTETSLLGICFLMYSKNIKLDDALIKLHMDYGRPFFIFKSDYFLLEKLEPILNRFSPLNYEEDDDEDEDDNEASSNDSWKNLTFEDNTFLIKSALLSPKSDSKRRSSVGVSRNSVITTATGQHVVQLRGQQIQTPQLGVSVTGDTRSESSFGSSSSTSTSSDSEDEIDIGGPCESVAGSLPSRILPHLYLGSLAHASSVPLLKELGINYLVSVGERIPWVDDLNYSIESTESGCDILKFSQRSGKGSKCYVNEVMRISNINDDGIGTLTTTINDALEFIGKCYNEGGKVLVHCQVGVSRSATVCIAEVMKRLSISLPRAYLFVRVRRLNVIIQPNLKLMYELFKWEENFVKSKIKKRQSSVSSVNSITASNSSTLFSNNSERSSFSASISSVNSNFTTSSLRENSISGVSFKPRLSVVNFEKSIVEEEDVFIQSDSSDSESTSTTSSSVPTATRFKKISFTQQQQQQPTTKTCSSFPPHVIKTNYNHVSPKTSVDIGSDQHDMIASNCPGFIREVDWFILCREIFNLNRAYINPSS